ncbi:hypothetical protein AT278_14165 [Bacillus cereus]|uniref:hypothetical protein n=1 Tax=Bacillus TaxID=1386 RepID=UPI00077ABF60|nr:MULTISPECIES: hypothetical protein [Bacillus]KAB7675459.1 hypothetical protein GBN91_27240 [Bacillus sp. B1-WWTP-T-0.5-Post-4]KXY57117.1 hypothetical protein AT278_14165 [Bacillus cereus]PGM73033.1 hypothetical protein CN952_10740 [Bacillus cereus]PGN06954.1 hypothetical protein CN954_24050 [Bacillus cereus]HDR4868834.1 hypothetical protein [Bacillus cereus]
MAIKQHSFKADSSKPDEKMINDFLEGKPTQYHIIEAMKIYVRIENAKQAAIEKMIANMQTGLFAQSSEQAPREAPKANDAIKEFDL